MTGTGVLLPATDAFAQCTVPNGGQIPNSLTSGYDNINISELGDSRKHSDSSQHNGTDYFYQTGTKMTITPGCGIQKNSSGNIIWEQNSKKVNGEPEGYGYYMMLDCGKTATDEDVKIRIAHVPKNPYNSATQSILQGCSGNANCEEGHQHFHIEMIVGDKFVDSQCVWGITKTGRNAQGASDECKKCPNIGKANLCDESVVKALKQQSADCKTSNSASIKGGNTVDPDTIQGVTSQPDPASTGNPNGEDGTGMDASDPGGPGNTPIPDGGNGGDDTPPIDPPEPPTPGTPGGDPNLTPEPKGKGPEELSGCATDTWTAMVNQAVMESRREDILNKRFIVKADSVLQYSCFDNAVKSMKKDIAPIFSGSERWAKVDVPLWGKKSGEKKEATAKIEIYKKDFKTEKGYDIELLSPKTLNESLTLLVDEAFTNYRRGQFNHKALSGSTGLSIGGPSDLCIDMAAVWKSAKCRHFDGTDVFYTFEDLKTKEPREFPANMKCDK